MSRNFHLKLYWSSKDLNFQLVLDVRINLRDIICRFPRFIFTKKSTLSNIRTLKVRISMQKYYTVEINKTEWLVIILKLLNK